MRDKSEMYAKGHDIMADIMGDYTAFTKLVGEAILEDCTAFTKLVGEAIENNEYTEDMQKRGEILSGIQYNIDGMINKIIKGKQEGYDIKVNLTADVSVNIPEHKGEKEC